MIASFCINGEESDSITVGSDTESITISTALANSVEPYLITKTRSAGNLSEATDPAESIIIDTEIPSNGDILDLKANSDFGHLMLTIHNNYSYIYRIKADSI